MDELKTMIRALAISNAASGITVAQLNKDFKNLEGYPIPYSKFGFQSLDGMLRTMTDAIRVNGYGPMAEIHPLNNEKSQHVRQMVKMSKPLKKKPSLRYHSPQTNFRNNFYEDHYSSHLDDYDDNGYNTKSANTNTFYTTAIPNNNVPKQQLQNGHQYDNLHRDVLPKTPVLVEKSVGSACVKPPDLSNQLSYELPKTPIPAAKGVTSPAVKPLDPINQMEKTPDAIINPLAMDYKRTHRMIDETSAKTPIEKINGSVCKPTNNIIMPEGVMTSKERVIANTFPAHVKPNATVQVVITTILNPRHMFVHFKEHIDQLLKLAPHIDKIYNAKLTAYEWLIPENMIEVGLYCAALYHGQWYRAQVMGPVNFQRVLLLYIDYGYLRYVPLTEIRFLTRELASIPRQTARVALKYLKPSYGTWSRECCTQLANLVHRKVFQMHVIDIDAKENLLDVILTNATNGSVDSFVHTRDDSNLNRQLAMRNDIVWSAD
ncbi:uncharacterized protein LOC128303763 [Anopheles moucheti]|uniref:uncharacterized protein LOC128303763 n=1 Tax=Anopheles moucheti TaxID=186751 RepID=UPI0022EFFE00|nr:uncharacterized protein LOC128303763 [Anopheles moucheti]